MGSPELKRRFLTFGEKIEVIRLSKTKISQRKLAFTYGVSLGTINRTLKQKRDILNASESENWNPERRRLKSGNDDLNVAVLKWFVAARSKNIPISGPLIKEKARLIAKDMGLNDFKGSNGWLSSFQTRNNILFKAIRKGSAKVNTYDVNKWNATLPKLCENNAAEDILTKEETGVLHSHSPVQSRVYKALHSHSPVQSNDPCNGIETSKGYSPVLAGSDMTNFGGYIQKCPTSGCNGEGHVTGRFTAHHKLSGCPIAPQNKEKLLMYQYMNGDARSSPEDLKPIEPVKIPKKRGRKKKKRDRDENEALSTLHQGIHQSVFMSTYVPPNPAKDLPLNWDQHSKLLPGLSSVTGGSAIRWSVDDVTRFVMSLPGCADVSQHFKEEQIDGEAFLLLNQTDMVKILNMKLGPAIKIYNSILMLKRTLET